MCQVCDVDLLCGEIFGAYGFVGKSCTASKRVHSQIVKSAA